MIANIVLYAGTAAQQRSLRCIFPEKKTVSFNISKDSRIARPAGLSLWIPNAMIVRDNGKQEIGRIIQDLPRKYEFEPSPGVKYTIEKSTVRKVTWLPETE